MEITEKPAKTKRQLPKLTKPLLAALVAVAIFVVGINVGNGRITLSRDKLSSTQKGLPADLDYSSVEQVYDTLKKDYDGQLDAGKLMDGLKQGLVQASGDQYTEYMNAKDSQGFQDELNGSFTGIGAELGKEDDNIIVVSPIAGYPAEKAGLKPKDIISKIDGEQTHDLTITEAVNKIRGEKGTKVKLTIIRDGKQELNLEILRAEITIPSVNSEVLEGNIGYIKISRFGEDTGRLSREAAQKFKTAGVTGVILDVRGNPGGLVTAAVDVSSLWVPSGQVVMREKRGDTVLQTLYASGDSPLKGIPTVVLIDEGSASASEITAGALKDNRAASLIGQKSFGKGSMQQLEDLAGGGLLKVTIARWYTPNDKNIDKSGIQPDTKVERTDDDFAHNRDPQKDAALQSLRK